jgi:hypothetical protein
VTTYPIFPVRHDAPSANTDAEAERNGGVLPPPPLDVQARTRQLAAHTHPDPTSATCEG